jgi:type IV secretion system protein VirB6
MDDFLGELLNRIEASGANFSEQAYSVVGNEIMPLLQLMFVFYVAYYGLQLFMGTARVSVAEIAGRVVRMMVILALIGQWGNFNTLFYEWLSNTPEDVGRAILTASGTGITEPTNGMSMIWNTANKAAAAFSEQAGFFSVLPGLIGFFIMVMAGLFIGVALSILILAKVMMWVLIGTSPIFIGAMLFPQTRQYGVGWFNQVLLYALIPLFVYVVAAFLIAAMDPELTAINAKTQSRTLQLSDFASFILLCLAGAFVLFNIQTLAQGIIGGISAGIGGTARWASSKAVGSSRGAAGRVGDIGAANHKRIWTGHSKAMQNQLEAMQNRISANSIPK